MEVINHGNPQMYQNGTFPEPIGGVPVGRADFVVSLLFGIGFAVVFGWNVSTFFSKTKRIGLRIATTSLSFERMVVTSMRMAAALRPDVRSWGLTQYQQTTLGVGPVLVSQQILYFTLCTAVLATRDGKNFEEWEKAVEKDPHVKELRKDEREKYRKWAARIDWAVSIAEGIQGASATATWKAGVHQSTDGYLNLRLISNLFCCMLIVAIFSMLYRITNIEAINKKAIRRLHVSAFLLMVIYMFRSAVSRRMSASLLTSPASALPARIAFYICQLLPELIVLGICAITDYRQISDTGMWGDYPRRRIEQGLSPRSPFFLVMRIVFSPWQWQRVVYNWIRRWRERRAQARAQSQSQAQIPPLFYDDTREKSFMSLSHSRRQSTTDLSTIRPSQVDIEKQSTWSVPISNYSRGWTVLGGSSCSASGDKPEVKESLPTPPAPLVTDVNLWRPRLPPGFSSR